MFSRMCTFPSRKEEFVIKAFIIARPSEANGAAAKFAQERIVVLLVRAEIGAGLLHLGEVRIP